MFQFMNVRFKHAFSDIKRILFVNYLQGDVNYARYARIYDTFMMFMMMNLILV